MPTKVRDAQHWLDRAEEARAQAEEMTHPPAKREMPQIAALNAVVPQPSSQAGGYADHRSIWPCLRCFSRAIACVENEWDAEL